MKTLRITTLLALLMLAASAHASIVLGGTRVIYREGRPEVTLPATNEGTSPELIQVWIDDGDANKAPETIRVPFTVTPAVARVEPSGAQSLRIRAQPNALPKDRESVYWLNVLSIPRVDPEAAASSDGAHIQFAMRTRIKLFYRPKKLAGDVTEAAGLVQWALEKRDGKVVLRATNPTPYYVSFASVALVVGDREYGGDKASNGGGGMVPPLDTLVFPLGDLAQIPAGPVSINAEWINDYGGSSALTAALPH